MTITPSALPSGSRIQRGFFSDLFCGCFGCCKDDEGEAAPLILDGNSICDRHFGTVEAKFNEIVNSRGAIYRKGNARVAIIDRGGEIQVEGSDPDGTEYSGAMQYKVDDDVFDFGGVDSKPKKAGLGALMLSIALEGRPHVRTIRVSNVTGSYGFYTHLGFRNTSGLTPDEVADQTKSALARTREEKEKLHFNLRHFEIDRDTLLAKLNPQWVEG